MIQEKDENEKTLEMLNRLSLSEVNLDQLLECQYVQARFGRFKRQNLDKIKYYEVDHLYLINLEKIIIMFGAVI